MEGETTIDVQIRDVLLGILSNMESRNEEVSERREDIWNVAYPNDGSYATLTTGTTDIDFDAGTVVSPAGVVTTLSSSLRKKGKDHLQSAAIKADVGIILQFDSEDKFPVDAGEWFQANHYEFRRLRITTTVATDCIVLASTGE